MGKRKAIDLIVHKKCPLEVMYIGDIHLHLYIDIKPSWSLPLTLTHVKATFFHKLTTPQSQIKARPL